MAISHQPTTQVFPHDDGWGYRVHCPGCDVIIDEGVKQTKTEAEVAATTASGAHKVTGA